MSIQRNPVPQRPAHGLAGRLQASFSAMAGWLSTMRPFGVRPQESAMQSSQRGKLVCACMPLRVKRPSPERRQVCRTCGLDVRAVSRNVDRALTTKEIQAVVRNLKTAGVRSAGLEIPHRITTLRQLNLYLSSDAIKLVRPTENIQLRSLPR